MEITDIRIQTNNDEKLKAYVAVTFDEVFVIHNMKIIHGEKGLFIAMPSRKIASGEFKDIAHPVNSEFRFYLQDKVLERYKAQIEGN